MIDFQKNIARIIAAQICCESGIIAKKIFTESTDKAPENLQTYEAILRFLDFIRISIREHFLQAMASLEHAKKIEPRCSKVWSMLARVYITIYCFEIAGFTIEEAQEKAVFYAEEGQMLAPDCQLARVVLAFVRLASGEIAAAITEIDQAYALHPDSIVVLDSIGYVMVSSGNWEEGGRLINKAIKRNPYYPDYVHYALWMNRVQQNDYEQAYQETMRLRSPQVFWDPLAKASTLWNLGRLNEGKQCVADLLALKPEFQTRGRILIGNYIKFDHIVEQIVNGLKKCGLDID